MLFLFVLQFHGKTEVVLFKSSRKLTDVPLKRNGKRLYPKNTVKYLGINIDENRNQNWNTF